MLCRDSISLLLVLWQSFFLRWETYISSFGFLTLRTWWLPASWRLAALPRRYIVLSLDFPSEILNLFAWQAQFAVKMEIHGVRHENEKQSKSIEKNFCYIYCIWREIMVVTLQCVSLSRRILKWTVYYPSFMKYWKCLLRSIPREICQIFNLSWIENSLRTRSGKDSTGDLKRKVFVGGGGCCFCFSRGLSALETGW